MKKIVEIEGMHCAHCQATAEKALNEIDGVNAKVDLKKKRAMITLENDIPDQLIKDILKEVNFEVVSIKEKKGLFS